MSLGRRRFLLPALVLVVLSVCFFFSPSSLFSSSSFSSGSWARTGSLTTQPERVLEIHGLLHFVVTEPDNVLGSDPDESLDPHSPIGLSVYEGKNEHVEASSAQDWARHVDTLDRESPLVVFSKTYCPFSLRAKQLLGLYDLHPPPKVVEVDTRNDGDLIKSILTRLTGRSTFPNVILKGQSIGGSDTLMELHNSGKLAGILRDAGIDIRANLDTMV